MKGNNSGVVKRCMENRAGWEETADFNTMFNFKWQQTSYGIRFDQLSINGKKQMVNHFINHASITTKDNLFKNLYDYLDNKVFDYVPLTFWIESDSENYIRDFGNFKLIFKTCQKYIDEGLTADNQALMVDDISKKFLANLGLKKTSRLKPSSDLVLPDTHFDGYNLWFLKVTKLNRGRGIYVFDTLDKLVSLIKDLEEGIVMQATEGATTSIDAAKETKTDGTFSNLSSVPNKIQSSTFVIQKYIEKPLLINKRKFDIRVWIMLTHDLKVHFFKEGYLRTSSEDFSLKSEDVWKLYVHLTNNAVQKNSDNYGQFEDGNQISFQDFQTYLDENYTEANINVRNDLISKMHDIVRITFKSVESFLFGDNKRSWFEIFGYDFIIDSDFKPWLIEINTNPCLEESSELLRSLIPRMIDDALKLTLDTMFKKKSKGEYFLTLNTL